MSSLDFKVSYTFLSTYKRCRKWAYLMFIKKVIPREEVNHRPFIVGIVADWLFNKWVEKGFPLGWMEEEAQALFLWFATKKHIIYRDSEDKGKLIYKLKKSVRFLQEISFAENLPDRVLETQKRLNKKTGGINYVGKLDIWFPDENLIWDLKITASQRYLDSFQLYLYAWLMQLDGYEIKGLAFFSPLMRSYLKQVPISASIMDRFQKELFDLLALIKEGHWEKTAKDCWGCPCQKFCEQEIETTKFKKLSSGGFRFDL